MRERKSAFQGTPNTHTQQATPMNLLGLGLQGRGTAGWAEISTLTLYSWCFTDLLKGQQRWDSVSGFSYSQGGSEGHDCEVAWESPSQGQGHGLDHGEPLQTTSPSSTEKAGGGDRTSAPRSKALRPLASQSPPRQTARTRPRRLGDGARRGSLGPPSQVTADRPRPQKGRVVGRPSPGTATATSPRLRRAHFPAREPPTSLAFVLTWRRPRRAAPSPDVAGPQ